MEMNDGAGLRPDRKCNLLADYIYEMIANDFGSVWSNSYDDVSVKWGVNEDDEFYVRFKKLHNVEQKLMNELEGKGLSFEPNTEKEQPYKIPKEGLLEFSKFLRNCGGFQVW